MHSAFSGKKLAFGLFFVGIFLAANTGGVFASQMTDGGVAANCPYMGAPVLCAMNPLQHLSEWQQTFATTAQQLSTELLLLVLAVVLLFSVHPRLLEPRLVRGHLYRSPPSIPQNKKTIRWLSLFELSPSRL